MKLTCNIKKQVEKAETKDEKKSLIENAGMLLTDEEVETVSGGAGGRGFYMSVGNCNGSYLALRPQPVWDQYHEIAQLYPGYEVFTYGETTNGTGLNGVHCSYTYVSFNGIWGWADSAFLH
ncbi:MAG: hypothetical protein K6A90_02070 [Lachnospiraceae bacterium]|nr:hypothetical protein [Lachnospiraceae bacterium]